MWLSSTLLVILYNWRIGKVWWCEDTPVQHTLFESLVKWMIGHIAYTVRINPLHTLLNGENYIFLYWKEDKF